MRPCSHCGELIADNTTVCPHCGAFKPFSVGRAGASAELQQEGTEGGRDGFFKGLLKDVGCQLALGCGGLLAVVIVAVLLAVVAGFCGGGNDFGYDPETQEINCQEYLDIEVDSSVGLLWGEDEVEVFSITANQERDRLDWDKRVCPGIANTSRGKYEIWYFVTGEYETEWSLDYDMRALESSETPNP